MGVSSLRFAGEKRNQFLGLFISIKTVLSTNSKLIS